MISIYFTLGFVFSLNIFSKQVFSLPMIGIWFYGGVFFLGWIYFAGFESSRFQATLGKRVLGLKVTSLSGKRIGFLRASVRYFCKILSRLIFMIGFFMIPFTKKNQGLHDKIAQTLVI